MSARTSDAPAPLAAMAAPESAPLVAVPLEVKVSGLPSEQIEVLRKTICKDLTNDELLLFLTRCARKGLDPFDQVYVFVKKNPDGSRDFSEGFTMGTKIDGMRALSRRSGKFGGRSVELLYDLPPADPKAKVIGARCTVTRTDVPLPFVEDALLAEYHKGRMWNSMPETMIRKVAESKALRAAFPNEMAGWYEPAEMEGGA